MAPNIPAQNKLGSGVIIVLNAAKFLNDKNAGLFDMQDVLGLR